MGSVCVWIVYPYFIFLECLYLLFSPFTFLFPFYLCCTSHLAIQRVEWPVFAYGELHPFLILDPPVPVPFVSPFNVLFPIVYVTPRISPSRGFSGQCLCLERQRVAPYLLSSVSLSVSSVNIDCSILQTSEAKLMRR